MNYAFMTDASCDLTEMHVNEIGVEVLPMEFEIEGKRYLHYTDAKMMSLEEFYEKIRAGADVKTTQINYNDFINYFENYLRAGKDVLYTGIASGLSGTFSTCLMAVRELKEKYPDRKIIAIDSGCDSAGLGFLVYLAGKKYASGASIDELAEYIESVKLNIAHWFVVDDLDRLKKGGRISTVTAAFGKALQIKPLISADNTGKLVNVGKIRGKSNIVPTLVKYLERDGIDTKHEIVFIAHADNKQGAAELQKAIKNKCREVQICEIGPIIGAHVGSGMLAIVFQGNRNLMQNS